MIIPTLLVVEAKAFCEYCNAPVNKGQVFCSSECDNALFEGLYGPCCEGCNTPGSFHDGLCYSCQCNHHAAGVYDMDGAGWR